MRKTTAMLTALFLLVVGSALAEYSVSDRGEWPKNWPKQLEPLRKQSNTYIGPMVEFQWFAMHFANRAQFEAAWPYILKVKSKGAPIYLVGAPNFFLGEQCKAGVVVHCPPLPQPGSPSKASAVDTNNPAERSMNETYIQLLVDGDIVDLKRITIPKGVKIIDERDKSGEKKP